MTPLHRLGCIISHLEPQEGLSFTGKEIAALKQDIEKVKNDIETAANEMKISPIMFGDKRQFDQYYQSVLDAIDTRFDGIRNKFTKDGRIPLLLRQKQEMDDLINPAVKTSKEEFAKILEVKKSIDEAAKLGTSMVGC